MLRVSTPNNVLSKHRTCTRTQRCLPRLPRTCGFSHLMDQRHPHVKDDQLRARGVIQSTGTGSAPLWCEDHTLLCSMFSLPDSPSSHLQSVAHVRRYVDMFARFVSSLQVRSYAYSTIM